MGIFRWYRVRVANKKGSHPLNSRVVGPGTYPETGLEEIDGRCPLTARGRTTENARAVTRCAAPERWCHPQASQAIESPDEGTARHPAGQRAQESRNDLPSAIFQLARRTRSQQLAQNQAQVERSYMDQLPLQNVLPPS